MYLNLELKFKGIFMFLMLTNDLIIKISKQCIKYKNKNRYPPFFPNQNSRMNPNGVLKMLQLRSYSGVFSYII